MSTDSIGTSADGTLRTGGPEPRVSLRGWARAGLLQRQPAGGAWSTPQAFRMLQCPCECAWERVHMWGYACVCVCVCTCGATHVCVCACARVGTCVQGASRTSTSAGCFLMGAESWGRAVLTFSREGGRVTF